MQVSPFAAYHGARSGNNKAMESNTVVVCIGSDKVSGDMLGPLVGSTLRDEYELGCPVYGAVGESVNGLNLSEYLTMLRERHPTASVIAVDAALGKADDIGSIRLKRGGIRAGGAMEKPLERVGDVGIIGVVAEKRAPEEVYAALLAVPYDFVAALAERIAKMIYTVLERAC